MFDTQLREEFAEDSDLAHDTCTTCLTSITEVDGIWYHDHGDGHGLAQHLARPPRRPTVPPHGTNPGIMEA